MQDILVVVHGNGRECVGSVVRVGEIRKSVVRVGGVVRVGKN